MNKEQISKNIIKITCVICDGDDYKCYSCDGKGSVDYHNVIGKNICDKCLMKGSEKDFSYIEETDGINYYVFQVCYNCDRR